MSAWYEHEAELESTLAGEGAEGEEHFMRGSFRAPPRMRAASRPVRSSAGGRLGAAGGRFRSGSAQGRPRGFAAWSRLSGAAPGRQGAGGTPGSLHRGRPRRRWPWLVYGVPPYVASSSPVYQWLADGPPAVAPEPDAAQEPGPEPGATAEPGAGPAEEPSQDAQGGPPEGGPPEGGEPPPEGQGAQEYEARRAQSGPLTARILKWEVRSLDRHPFPGIPAGGGLYIVEKNGVPLYVGEAERFGRRWWGRLQALHQLGLTSDTGQLPAPITVWFGTVQPNQDAVRKAVEHALIRTLLLADIVPRARLRNASSFKEFLAVNPIRVDNVLPRREWIDKARQSRALKGFFRVNSLLIPGAQTYELHGG